MVYEFEPVSSISIADGDDEPQDRHRDTLDMYEWENDITDSYW